VELIVENRLHTSMILELIMSKANAAHTHASYINIYNPLQNVNRYTALSKIGVFM